ncbi:DNRLRE domain-containing protein [Actinoplanes friuliensis]|uniref:DNRLRE domain-containing protein n=1 Tax=Actinoplanes friuliensis TaxID=196914 RepID=UPI0005A1DB33|nr:DNRLRE domain-containing protein [Actinoplanes friuliensis]
MTVPRFLRYFVRTRTRLICTAGLVIAALVAASVPWWPSTSDSPAATAGAPAPAPGAVQFRDREAALTEARQSKKEVLVDSATTGNSQTWALPDGQLRTRTHAVTQQTQDSQGAWKPVDMNLASAKDATPGGLSVRPGNPPTPVRFAGASTPKAGEADTVLAELEIGGRTIAYTWPGALPAPVLDGSRALYPEVLPGVDLLLVARQEGGFGQLLIVKTREAAKNKELASLSYGLRSDSAVFRRNATTGGVRILDAKTKTEVGSIPTPMAWDSSGKDPESPEAPRLSVATDADVLKLSGLGGFEPGSREAPMPTRLDGDGTGSARLHLDVASTGLLSDARVRFPVFLDPPINSGEQAWLFVHKKNPNSNFLNGTSYNGGTTDARVGYESENGGTARSFWRMGFKNIKGAKVSSASFKVLNNHSWSCTSREFQLYFTGAISSGTTWNKQPSWTALQQKKSFAYGYGSNCSDEYVAFNVQNAAQRAADAGATNVTLGMRATSEDDTQTWRKFAATTATLEAVYNTPPKEPTNGVSSPGGACVPGPTGQLGVTVGKTNIVLSAKAVDPDSNLSKLRFQFWKAGTSLPAGTAVTPDSTGKASLTIASSTLVDKTTYAWAVRAEDSSGEESSYFPPGDYACLLTIDATKPPAPDVESDVWLEATPDGATWSTVKFGATGPITFKSDGAKKFEYSFEYVLPTTVTTTTGTYTVPALAPRHSGPTTLVVYAYDAAGNRSDATLYQFYVPPRDVADGPGDVGGDGRADLLVIDASGRLLTLPGDTDGELYGSLSASYSTGGKLNPAGHWLDAATGKAALIAKFGDVYPGDGTTDLFARTPDGGFWLYPGDGYGSFNIDDRLKVLLPSNTPAPSTWTQIKAVGDITGDKLPDLALRAGTAFWVLSGYTGGSFQTATLMEGTAWGRGEIVNIADIDLDGTPDLTWRHLDTGVMSLRHGKPGTVAGSVNLDSLKTAAASRSGDVQYGTGWSASGIYAVIGVPDVNGDRVPDMWAVTGSDGTTRVYHATTTWGGSQKTVLSVDWRTIKAFG